MIIIRRGSMKEQQRKRMKPVAIPGEFEDHPDTRRLDWLLKFIGFDRTKYVYIDYPSELKLRSELERAWRRIDSDDLRQIIDRAMEGEDE
jgi:hypothetical protein